MSKMTGFFRRFGSTLYFSVGADRVSGDYRRYTLMHCIFLLATSTTTTFVTTLLMRVCSNSDITLWYNIVHFPFVASSMVVAAILMHKKGARVTILWGVGVSMLVYLLILVFMNHIDRVFWLIAIVHGMATGLYWITYFDALLRYTTDDNRDVAMNFTGVFSGLISLVMPLFSGWVIDLFAGYIGYYITFAFCFLMAGVAVFLVLRLPSDKPDRKPTRFRRLLKGIYTEKVWFFVMHMDFFRGIREGAFSFFLNVLIFSIVQSETLVGFNTFLVGILSMISCVVAGRYTRPNNRLKLMLMGTMLLSLAVGVLYFQMNVWTMLLLSAVNAFLGVFIMNPVGTTLYTVFDRLPGAGELRNEALSVTECYKNGGRIFGVVLILLLPSTEFWYITALLILVASQFITTGMAKLTLHLLNKANGGLTDKEELPE